MITVDPKFPNSIPAAIVVDTANLPKYAVDRVIPLSVDSTGALLVTVAGAISVTATIGSVVSIADTMAFPTGSLIGSVGVGFNGSSYDRLRTVADNADAVAVGTLGRLLAVVRNTLFNGTTWDRARSLVDNADANAVATTGLAGVIARLQGYNPGTNQWDRIQAVGDASDAIATSTTGHVNTRSHNTLFNETTWDRIRGNTNNTLLASAARTATTNSADATNYNAKGAHIIINVTAITTSSLTVTVQGKCPISGVYYDILVGAAITSTGITILKVFPGVAAVANGSASDILPRTFRVSCAKGDASSWTYSVAAALVV